MANTTNYSVERAGKRLVIRGAQVRYKNFSGTPDQFTPAGKRKFDIVIDPDNAQTLAQEGWNAKAHYPKDDPDGVWYSIPVEVSFKKYTPTIYRMTDNKKRLMSENDLARLDAEDILYADVILDPSVWGNEGKIKAYLREGYFFVYESVLGRLYDNVPTDDIPF